MYVYFNIYIYIEVVFCSQMKDILLYNDHVSGLTDNNLNNVNDTTHYTCVYLSQ